MNRFAVRIWGSLVVAALVAAAYAIFVYAPLEQTMGIVQKIFYLHVPSAFVMFGAFVLSGGAGALYIAKRTDKLDALSEASAEVGLLFCTIVLVTGPLWGKIAWGAWWTWEPRLTATLILWLIFVSYFILRSSMENPQTAKLYAAVLAVFGCLDIPIIVGAVRLWRGVHPEVIRTEGGLPPSMQLTLLVSALAIILLGVTLILWRYRNATRDLFAKEER